MIGIVTTLLLGSVCFSLLVSERTTLGAVAGAMALFRGLVAVRQVRRLMDTEEEEE